MRQSSRHNEDGYEDGMGPRGDLRISNVIDRGDLPAAEVDGGGRGGARGAARRAELETGRRLSFSAIRRARSSLKLARAACWPLVQLSNTSIQLMWWLKLTL